MPFHLAVFHLALQLVPSKFIFLEETLNLKVLALLAKWIFHTQINQFVTLIDVRTTGLCLQSKIYFFSFEINCPTSIKKPNEA